MFLGEEFEVFGSWFRIHFLENKGMAFGLSIPGEAGKYILSIFRVVVVLGLIFYLRHLMKFKVSYLAIVSISLIIAGALGNIIDSLFYGIIYADINNYTEGFLQGRVVDMLYFPLFEGTYPDWVPRLGGGRFEFFRPVFNIADASISIGIVLLFLIQRQFSNLRDEVSEEENTISETQMDISSENQDKGTSEI